jgi:hypothetical protein
MHEKFIIVKLRSFISDQTDPIKSDFFFASEDVVSGQSRTI